jgi:V/A-type H+-transporting ATPase subunit E
LDGLQAIVERILAEARDKAGEIAAQAQARCDGILSDAKAQADVILSDGQKQADIQAQALITRAKSAAALESRKKILGTRQEMIDRVFGQALRSLASLPAQEKLDFYQQLIIGTGAEDGEIVLAAADQLLGRDLLARLPGRFTLSSEAGACSGGLILRRGLIEDNLTFERLIDVQRPRLVNLAADLLADPGEAAPGR